MPVHFRGIAVHEDIAISQPRVNQIIGHVNSIVDQHPELKDVAISIPSVDDFYGHDAEPSNSTLAFYDSRSNSITLNPGRYTDKWLRDHESGAAQYEWETKSPQWLASSDPMHTITHELGHALLANIAKQRNAGTGEELVSMKMLKRFRDASPNGRVDFEQSMKLMKSVAPSKYAIHGGPHEFAAEAFLAINHGIPNQNIKNHAKRIAFARDLWGAIIEGKP